MAGQGIFFRAFNLTGSCRLFLNNRMSQINLQPQIAGIKQTPAEKLKELNLPEKPKRPLSAYFKFLRDNRESLLKQNPGLRVIEISKKCALVWKEVDSTIKQKYEEEYKAEMEQYTKKFLEYSAKLTPEQKEALKSVNEEVKSEKKKRGLRKKMRDNNKPKRPIGAYIMYVMDQAKTHEKKYNELLVSLKGQWTELPESVKEKYHEAALKYKEKYDQEIAAWEKKMIEQGNADLVRNKTLGGTKKAQSLQKDDQNKSTKESQMHKDIYLKEAVMEKGTVDVRGGGENEVPGVLQKLKDMFTFKKS